MTLYHEADRTQFTQRRSVVNLLKNGGFLVPRQYTVINRHAATGGAASGVYRTEYTYRIQDSGSSPSQATKTSIPGFFVGAEPEVENTVGYWDIWGAYARVLVNGESTSLDGGNLLTFSMLESGRVTLRQSVENFYRFRGHKVTTVLSGKTEKGSVQVTPALDTGTQLDGRLFSSDYFGPYYRMIQVFDVPLDASKFDVLFFIDGKKGASASVSGACLAFGPYAGDLPFSESLPDIALPSGSIIGWFGEACPAGFKSLPEGAYLLPVLGDPNAVRGNLYDGSTAGGGTTDSMGTRGDLTVGGGHHSHKATPAQSGKVIQGVGFEAQGLSETVVDLDQDEVRFTDVLLSVGNDYIRIFTPTHKHTMVIPNTEVEPPRMLLRLCEKI